MLKITYDLNSQVTRIIGINITSDATVASARTFNTEHTYRFNTKNYLLELIKHIGLNCELVFKGHRVHTKFRDILDILIIIPTRKIVNLQC